MIVPRQRAAVLPATVSLSKLLLVEGETPAHFFEALLNELNLSSEIEVRSYGGITQLRKYLTTISADSGFKKFVKSVGIARDCEDDPIAAKDSIDSAIQAAKLSPQLRVNSVLLPDSKTKGMIEHLMLRSVLGKPGMDCVGTFDRCLATKGIPLPVGIIRAKNLTQAYLATFPESQMMPGFASYKNVWDFGHSAFDEVKTFLKDM